MITGTSSGIGHASARLLDRLGYRVFAGVRRPEDGERLRAGASERLRPVILDITVPEHLHEASRIVRDELGTGRGLRGLVNNAGICEPGPLEAISMERFRKQMEVNVVCHLSVIQTFLPLIRQESGRVINVTSAIARAPLPCFGAYVASKCAMEGMSDVLRRELRGWGIYVSMIEPGTVEAAIWDKTPANPEDAEDPLTPEMQERYQDLTSQVQAVMQRGRAVAYPPERLAETVRKALESRWPKARYQCGPGAKMAVRSTQIPEFITDWFIEQILKRRLPTALMGW